MTFQLTIGAIWGIGVGAFALTLAGGLALIVLYCRLKRRRQLARLFSARERRLSGYPGGHMSITDEDVARMPGTRRARPSNQAPSGSSRGWTAISSRESLPKRPVKAMSKHSQSTVSSVPVWPLPPRLTRSTATPLAKYQVSTQSPTKNETESSKTFKIPDLTSNEVTSKGLEEYSLVMPRDDQMKSTEPEAFSASALKPKPLFHSKQRSISAGLILQHSEGEIQHADISTGSNTPGPPQIPKAHLPRSASLCSQHAGTVPTKPIPPLPFNFSTASRPQNITRLTEASSTRASGNSLLSGNTSILDDCLSRAMSQAETNLTSTSVLSGGVTCPELGRAGMADVKNHARPLSTSGGNFHPLQSSKASELQTKHEMRKSCRGSIVQSLPRSASSGLSLSLSLAPDSSCNASSTSLQKEKILPSRTPSLMVPKAVEGKGSRRGKSPASPLRNSTTFDSQEELKTDKKFLSTLKVISGNEVSMDISHRENNLSSGENDVFLWDPVSHMQPGKPSATKARSKGHLRQSDLKIQKNRDSHVRISDISPTAVHLTSSPVEETSLEALEQKIPPGFPSSLASGHALPRLPTRVKFDPQIVSNTYPKPARDIEGGDDSPTFSIFRYNLDTNSSSESLISSPSPRRRTPVHHRQSRSNPNRLKPVFSVPGEGRWSIMKFDSSFTADPTKPILEPEQATTQNVKTKMLSSQSSPVSASSPAYSFICPIPPDNDVSTRRSSPCGSPIRGPRPPPGSRSPLRGIGKSSSQSTTGSYRNLRKSIMALRRQNSEAQNSPLQEHRNYLGIDNKIECSSSRSGRGSYSVGDIHTLEDVDTEDEERGDGAKEQKKQPGDLPRSSDAAMMSTPSRQERFRWGPLSENLRPESPGTLYDSSGFLKE